MNKSLFKLKISNQLIKKLNRSLSNEELLYIDEQCNKTDEDIVDILYNKFKKPNNRLLNSDIRNMKLGDFMNKFNLSDRNISTDYNSTEKTTNGSAGKTTNSSTKKPTNSSARGNLGKNTEIDIHEYMNNNIGVSEELDVNNIKTDITKQIELNIWNILNIDNYQKFIEIFFPRVRYKSKTIVLDALYQNDLVNGSGKMSWDLTTSANIINGAINIRYGIKNIIGMRLYPPSWVNDNRSYNILNAMNLWTVLIEEMQAQSFNGPENRKFHFIFTLDLLIASVYPYNPSTPYGMMNIHGYNNGYFWFRKPFTLLDKITLSFGTPWYQFYFQSTKFIGTLGKDPFLTVTIQPDKYNSFDNAFFVLTGPNRISGFTTANPTTDAALITYVNSNTFTATYVSSYVAEFPIDLSAITLVPNTTISVYNMEFRTVFCIEFLYLDDEINEPSHIEPLYDSIDRRMDNYTPY